MSWNVTETDLKKRYEGIYSRYGESDGGASENYNSWILNDILKIAPSRKLLDVSCGAGYTLEAAAKDMLDVAGIDISEEAISRAQKRIPNADLKVGNAESLPWADESFDYVTCLGSFEHFLHAERVAAEISRVMKPEAASCILVHNRYAFEDILDVWFTGNIHMDGQGMEYSRTVNQWRDLLKDSGLNVEKVLVYNRFKTLFEKGGFKIKSLKKYFRYFLQRYVAPFNLAYHFVFICTKKMKG